MSLPLVSLLCVSRGREGAAEWALKQAEKQTYPNLELVIVDNGMGATLKSERVKIRWCAETPGATLGGLRNLSVVVSSGRYLTQWDDDDWYSFGRVQMQVTAFEAIRRERQSYEAIVLDRVMMWDQVTGKRALSIQRPFEGSIFGTREIFESQRYLDLSKGEDTEFVRTLVRRRKLYMISNGEELYEYRYHGTNTWDHEHFVNLMSSDPV